MPHRDRQLERAGFRAQDRQPAAVDRRTGRAAGDRGVVRASRRTREPMGRSRPGGRMAVDADASGSRREPRRARRRGMETGGQAGGLRLRREMDGRQGPVPAIRHARREAGARNRACRLSAALEVGTNGYKQGILQQHAAIPRREIRLPSQRRVTAPYRPCSKRGCYVSNNGGNCVLRRSEESIFRRSRKTTRNRARLPRERRESPRGRTEADSNRRKSPASRRDA